MEQKIVARFIVEMLGAPKEHVVKKLEDHIEMLKKEGVEIQIEKYAEPVQKDELFTQYVELQVAFKKLPEFFEFCFDNLPSSVEIMSPERVDVSMADFEDFMNDFQAHLHHADMMVKTLDAQKQLLDRNSVNVLRNFIKFCCLEPKTIQELAKFIGVGEKELTPFVDYLVNKSILKKEGQTFVIHG